MHIVSKGTNSFPYLFLSFQFDEGRSDYDSEQVKRLKNWVQSNSLPLVNEYTDEVRID